MKTYKILRTVVEEYEVTARNKEEALLIAEDPNKITVINEKITVKKDPIGWEMIRDLRQDELDIFHNVLESNSLEHITLAYKIATNTYYNEE